MAALLSQEVELLKEYLTTKGAVLELEFSEDKSFVEIKWKKDQLHHYVYSTDVVYHKGRLAWFQSSEEDVYHLCLLEKNQLWKWEPEMYNPVFGCLCLELYWMGEQLIFMYQEKHDIYIAIVHKGQVKHHNFHGQSYKLTPDKLVYQTHSQRIRKLVSWIDIPNLEKVEEVEWRIAKQLDLAPE